MDVLADVMQVLRLNASTYFCSELMGPWGMTIQKGNMGLFHAVVDGECWVVLDDYDAPIHLQAGDVVAFPTGASHKINAKDSEHWLPGKDVVTHIQNGNNPFAQGEPNVTLLCGSFEYDTSIQHPFLKDLPCFIHIEHSRNEEKWLNPFIHALASESRDQKPGANVIVDCLTEILFVQLMRAYMQQSKDKSGYIAALMHSQIGTALNAIHNDKQASCTVEGLADTLAMSRTTFTERFTQVVGMPPKRYIINWRMQKARNQLQTTQDTMISIAESAGYQSDAAFSKAYKQFFGQTPGMTRVAG